MQTTVIVEDFVKHFPRYHKYTLGSELRNTMRACLEAVMFAAMRPQYRAEHLTRVCEYVDKLILSLRLCYRCKVGSHQRRRIRFWRICVGQTILSFVSNCGDSLHGYMYFFALTPTQGHILVSHCATHNALPSQDLYSSLRF